MTTFRKRLSLLLCSLLLISCGGGGGSDSPAGVALLATPGVELLAGGIGGGGTRDATGTDARFVTPFGVALAPDGTRYVTDYGTQTIRKVTPAGVVTTLAGKAGEIGAADGTGSAARFFGPSGIAVAADGTIYVTDSGNYTIRKITPAGDVSTLAGTAGQQGRVDGSGGTVRLGFATGLVIASDGNLYFTEIDNRVVRMVTPAGEVTTIAGDPGVPGTSDGTGTAARFQIPLGLAIDGNDVLYVTDNGAHTIRRVTTAGVVDTWAGGATLPGLVNATGTNARFSAPVGIIAEADGTLYVSDSNNGLIRKVSPAAEVTTFATLGSVPDASVELTTPAGLVRDGSGIFTVADLGNHRLLSVSAAGVASTALGAAALPGATNATGAAARFDTPTAVAFADDGRVFVADSGNNVIRVIATDGTVSTLAGTAGESGFADGTGAEARFSIPTGIAVDTAGTAYVADSGNHVIRKITPAGVVTTLAGAATFPGSQDGESTVARFFQPSGLAVDARGNVFVADAGNHAIRKVTPTGTVTTLAGQLGISGSQDGTGTGARFSTPVGVAVAADGTVFVADQLNYAIRQVTSAGVVTTLAGSLGQAGDADGNGGTARFRSPTAVGVDTNGTLYVTDRDNHLIRTVTAAGDVATLAGVSGVAGVATGALPGGLNQPWGLALGNDGELYTTSENSIFKVTPVAPFPMFDLSLWSSATSLPRGDSLTLSWSSRDATNCQASGDWSGAKAVAGSSTFVAGTEGTFTYTLTCDENGGAGSKTQSVTVTVIPPEPTLTLTGSGPFVTPGDSFTLTWTGTDITSCTASGSWSGAKAGSGSETLTPASGAQSYTLDCTGPGGTVSKTVTTMVAPPPVVSLTASVATVASGDKLTLTWSSSNAFVCVAEGRWTGVRLLSGSEEVTAGAEGNVFYRMTCTGDGGSKTVTVPVTITEAKAASGGGGGGGGGSFDVGALAVLGGLLLARRRRT